MIVSFSSFNLLTEISWQIFLTIRVEEMAGVEELVELCSCGDTFSPDEY